MYAKGLLSLSQISVSREDGELSSSYGKYGVQNPTNLILNHWDKTLTSKDKNSIFWPSNCRTKPMHWSPKLNQLHNMQLKHICLVQPSKVLTLSTQKKWWFGWMVDLKAFTSYNSRLCSHFQETFMRPTSKVCDNTRKSIINRSRVILVHLADSKTYRHSNFSCK